MLRACIWIVIDLLLVGGILEATIFDGETRYCVTILPFFLVPLFTVWIVKKSNVLPPALNPLFVLLAVSVVLFWQGVATHEWFYCRLSQEPCDTVGYTDVASFISLLLLCIGTFRGSYGFFLEALQSRLYSSCALLLSGIFLSNIVLEQKPRWNFDIPEPYLLISLFLLLGLRSCLASVREVVVSSRTLIAGRMICAALPLILVAACILNAAMLIDDRTAKAASHRCPLSRAVLLLLLVSEDPTFLHHSGVDFVRLKDAIRETIENGGYKRGGSTLSMQLAKIEYLSYEKTLLRKLQQISISLVLEQRYTKEEILYAYLNEVPFTPEVKGFEQASLFFFRNAVVDLSDEQGLNLVLTIFNPTEYTPLTKTVPSSVFHRALTIKGRIEVFKSQLEFDLKEMLSG